MLQLSLRGTRKQWHEFPVMMECHVRSYSKPDRAVGGVGVCGRNRANDGPHFGRLRDHHPADRCGENRWLVHILHHQPDGSHVAERSLHSEARIHVLVGGFDFETVAWLCFKVETLERGQDKQKREKKNTKAEKRKDSYHQSPEPITPMLK